MPYGESAILSTFSRTATCLAQAHSPTNENQWSSAVGHATTNGKSGRVIERLMAENDRLKRTGTANITVTGAGAQPGDYEAAN